MFKVYSVDHTKSEEFEAVLEPYQVTLRTIMDLIVISKIIPYSVLRTMSEYNSYMRQVYPNYERDRLYDGIY